MAKTEPELYKPAEACRMAEVAPYVLRYWETEFPALAEGKEKGSAKLYSSRDVKIIARIRELLYDEGFTVAGAKKRLEAEIAEGRFDDGLKPPPPPAEQKPTAQAVAPPAPQTASPQTVKSQTAQPQTAQPQTAKTPQTVKPQTPPPSSVAAARQIRLDEPAFLSEPHAPAKTAPAPPSGGFEERKRVVRELKEIVKLLDHGKNR